MLIRKTNRNSTQQRQAGARFWGALILSFVTRRIEMYPLIIQTSYYYYITLKVNKAVKSWSGNNRRKAVGRHSGLVTNCVISNEDVPANCQSAANVNRKRTARKSKWIKPTGTYNNTAASNNNNNINNGRSFSKKCFIIFNNDHNQMAARWTSSFFLHDFIAEFRLIVVRLTVEVTSE